MGDHKTLEDFKYEDWQDGTILSVDGAFVLNPNPKRKLSKSLRDKLDCCKLTEVQLECGEYPKILATQRDIFNASADNVFRKLTRNFSSRYEHSRDKLDFLNNELNNCRFLLMEEVPGEVHDSSEVAVVVSNLKFSGAEVIAIRKIFMERCMLSNKSYGHIQPPASPLYNTTERSLDIETEGYAKFFQWLKSLRNLYEKHLNRIYKAGLLDQQKDGIENYLTFLSQYFTDELYMDFQDAFNDIIKYPNLVIHDPDESAFHAEIIFVIINKLKNKIHSRLEEASGKEDKKEIVSRVYSSVRKTLVKGKNRSRTLLEQNYYDKIFYSNDKVFNLLEEVISFLQEEHCCHIDKHHVVTADFHTFESIVLKSFSEKNNLLAGGKKLLVDKSKVSDSCLQLLAEFCDEYHYSHEVFVHKWIESYKHSGKNLTEENYIRELLSHISKNYLNFNHEKNKVSVSDHNGNEHLYDLDFYRGHILMLYIKVKNILEDRQRKISHLDGLPEVPATPAPQKNNVIITKKEPPPSFTYQPPGLKKEAIRCRLNDVRDKLTNSKNSFLLPYTPQKHFQKIFSGNPVKVDERIDWISPINELHYFVHLFHEKYKVVEYVFPQHWKVAANCFTHLGKPLTASQVKSNKIEPAFNRKNILDAIVKELTPTSL